MKTCEYCNAPTPKPLNCDNCGRFENTVGLTFIYGRTKSESISCEIVLTDKYLIIRDFPKKEMIGNMVGTSLMFGIGGIVGGLIGGAVGESIKRSEKRIKSYGFYDLKELHKVIYPYHTGELKKKLAMKFINKDGKDFVLNFDLNGVMSAKSASNFAASLAKVGVLIEDGTGKLYPNICDDPMADRNTFNKRVCASAVGFAIRHPDQFAVPPVGGAEDAFTAQAQPAYQQSAARPEPAPVQTSAAAERRCPACSAVCDAEDMFCCDCGTKLN